MTAPCSVHVKSRRSLYPRPVPSPEGPLRHLLKAPPNMVLFVLSTLTYSTEQFGSGTPNFRPNCLDRASMHSMNFLLGYCGESRRLTTRTNDGHT